MRAVGDDLQLEWSIWAARSTSTRSSGFDLRWCDSPGNYIFARRGRKGWEALYIGETDSLRMTINKRHAAWAYCRRPRRHPRARRISICAGRAARQVEEQALILAYDPPGNNPRAAAPTSGSPTSARAPEALGTHRDGPIGAHFEGSAAAP